MKITKKQINQIIKEEIQQALGELRTIPVGGGTARTCPELGKHLGEMWASGEFDDLNLVPGTDLDKMLRSASRDYGGGDDTLLSRDAAKLEVIANAMAQAAGVRTCSTASQNESYIAAFKKAVLSSAAGTKSKYADIKPDTGLPGQLPSKGPRGSRQNPWLGERRMAAESLIKLKQIIKEEIQNVQEEKSYPNNSTMRKLVKQAKMDGRYKEEDVEKLKKDYDKHVRGTLRDPKHSQAHKKSK